MEKKKFYITTPIYYVNGSPHIGSSYTTIAADVLARYHRLKGNKVFFLTGTDEHGGKIEKAAEKIGKSPKQLCDENVEKFKRAWNTLNISYDNFIRTTDSYHKEAVRKALEILYKKGLIYKGTYKGLYCLGCEQYKTESDLVDGKCPDHQKEPEIMEEESYLFKLSEFGDKIREKIEKDELLIRPEDKKEEVLNFLKKGLKDISVSREKVKWGVPLPFSPNLTSYVWIDAFLNYLTGIGWKGEKGKVPEFWPPDVQLMAKDIIRVHATIWTAILMGLEIPLPKQLFVHGYFTVDGQKMSKSLGNVIKPFELVNKFGVDGTRYLLLSACPFGNDGDISWEKLEEKYNADLAKGLGNLLARVITLAEKLDIKQYKDPQVPAKSFIDTQKENYDNGFKNLKFNESLSAVWEIIGYFDKYIEREEPWKGGKNAVEVVSDSLFALREIAELLKPFMPEASLKIIEQLKTKKSKPLFLRTKT
jgi:methionyl-tRNA synthetase